MEKFGDATTADIGSTRSSLSSRMTELIEKRLVGRTTISKMALLFFSAKPGVFACEVRNITNSGARIELTRVNLLPLKFELSFDNFLTVRKCRLVWRWRGSIGIAFEN
jgi:hypothetical protein